MSRFQLGSIIFPSFFFAVVLGESEVSSTSTEMSHVPIITRVLGALVSWKMDHANSAVGLNRLIERNADKSIGSRVFARKPISRGLA